MIKKCKGCGCLFDSLPSEDYCDDCVASEEHLKPWNYVVDDEAED